MAAKTRITLEEFLALPETEPASEFACGEVFQKPMPSGMHALLHGFFCTVLAPNQEPRTLVSGDTLDGGDVLPGFRVAVDDIFAQLQV
jgi:Uma2 family endonuclease